MAEPFIAEIRMYPISFAPRGWGYCDGRLIPLSQNTSLFSLIGITYGGDGRTTFALPNLQGQVPIGVGQGPGLSPITEGEKVGVATVRLTPAEIPSHTHRVMAFNANGSEDNPQGNLLARESFGSRDRLYTPDAHPQQNFASYAIDETGLSLSHENRQPYLVVSFIIALDGIYPPRS